MKPHFTPSATSNYVWIKWHEVVYMSDQKLGTELECKPSVTARESNAQRIQLATDDRSFDEESSLLKRSLISLQRDYSHAYIIHCLHPFPLCTYSSVNCPCRSPLWGSNRPEQISFFSNRKKWSLLSSRVWPVLITFLCAYSPFPYRLSAVIFQLGIHLTWTVIHYRFQFKNIL